MSDQDEAAVHAHMAENERWTRAEERAAEETQRRRKDHAAKLLTDPERLADALYERMAYATDECNAMCKTVARMLIYGELPAALLAVVAAEWADDIQPELYPGQFLDDDGDDEDVA